MNDFIKAIAPFFPATFNLQKYLKIEFKENAELYQMIVEIVVYIVAGVVSGAVLGVLGWLIGFLWPIWSIVGTVSGLYILGGIVLSVLKFCKVIKVSEEK